MAAADIHFSNLAKDSMTNHISFDIENIDVSIVNSIRRSIFSHVPNVGFYFAIQNHLTTHDIVIEKNDSPLHNEMLAHRMSLLPLHLTKEEIENWSDSDYTFVLKKANHGTHNVDVTTEDMTVLDREHKEMPRSFVKRIFPPNKITNEYVLITKLKPRLENVSQGNHVYMTLRAKKGIAKNCICWNDISECTYFNTVDENKAELALQEKLKAVSNPKEGKDVTTDFNLLEKYRHYHTNKFEEASKFTFSLQTENGLTPSDVFLSALKYLIDAMEELKDVTDGKDAATASISFDTDEGEFHMVSFKNCNNHTIGNMIQAYLVNRHINARKKEDVQHLTYAGYNVPHPLEEVFLLKMKFTDKVSRSQLRTFLAHGFMDIISILRNVQDKWIAFASEHKL
jgi:DNA-directed RNA polymerase subunit L/DNA-directed RNA polymerase alpha subunit